MTVSEQIRIEPSGAVAGQVGEWRVTYTVGAARLEAGASLTVARAYHSQLRFVWQASEPSDEGYVRVTGPAGTAFEVEVSGSVLSATLRSGTLAQGQEIEIVLGDRDGGSPGLRVWPVVHEMEFVLTVEPGHCVHSIKIPVDPDVANKILVKAPSTVVSGAEFPVLLRAVDAHGNTATTGCSQELALSCSSGDMEVAGTARLEGGLARISARPTDSAAGCVRIAVHEQNQDATHQSNPIAVVESPEERIFWGDLHCHSNIAQALEKPKFLYEYARDEEALDFICHTEHDAGTEERWIGPRWREWQPPVSSVPEYIDAIWEYRKKLVREYHEPGKFVTLLGYEWASNLYGHANVYYATDEAPIFYPDDFWQEEFTPAALWQKLEGLEAMVVPHHPSHRIRSEPGGFVSGWDWDFYDPEWMRLVEVYSKHGSSEYLGCPRAISDQVSEGCAQSALRRGYKVGFIACTDTHASRPGSDLAGDLCFRQGGLTAAFAPSLERRAIFDALRSRRCYGTSGQRIILRFWVDGAFMGEDARIEDAQAPKSARFELEGTADLASVAVVKNNRVAYETSAGSASLAGEYVDPAETRHTDSYYLRVLQEDGEMAWSSPIWITP